MSCDSDLFGNSRTAGCGAAGVLCADGEMCDSSLATPTCVPISITPIPDPAPSFTLVDVLPSKALSGGGNTVVLSGSGFIAASDSQVSVLVNGNLATNVHIISSTQISFTVPADTRQPGSNSGPVSIEVSIGTLGKVSLRDKFSYVPSRYEVRSKISLPASFQLRAVAVGRVNADRFDDVIVVSTSGATNYAMSFSADANGSGSLPQSSEKEISVGNSDVRAVAIGDYNSSTGTELAVHTANGSLAIYSTSFVGGQALATVNGIPDAPYFVPTRSDTADELLFPIRNLTKVYQYVPNAANVVLPDFSTGTAPQVMSNDVGAASADIDGDGRRDFITYFAGAGSYQAFFRTANGGYKGSPPKTFAVSPVLQQFVLGDITGDSKADLVYLSNGRLTLQPSMGVDPAFGPSSQTPPLPNISQLGGMTLAHVNARTDRVLDVVLVTNGTSPELMLFRGSPALALFDKISLPQTTGMVTSVTPADLNGDGLPDLVLGISDGTLNSGLVVLMHNGVD